MDDATSLVSRLIRAANSTDRISPIEVGRLLEFSVRMIERLRAQSKIVPIPGKDALIYLRTVATGADRVLSEEWRHALLHAAEMVRDLNIVIETGTIVNIVDARQPETEK